MDKIKAIEYRKVMKVIAKAKFEELFDLKIKSFSLCIESQITYLAASPGK